MEIEPSRPSKKSATCQLLSLEDQDLDRKEGTMGNIGRPVSLRFLNSKGSTLLQTLALSVIAAICLYSLINYTVVHRKQVTNTAGAMEASFAISSTLDYVLYGIKHRYCFSDDGLLVNAPTAECTLGHTGSVERLIMSQKEKDFIRDLHTNHAVDFGSDVDYDQLELSEIHRILQIENLSAQHPLAATLKKLALIKDSQTGEILDVSGIKIDITRDNSLYLPRAGQEVFAKVTATLIDSGGVPLKNGTTTLSLSSSIAIYPREIGTFALVLPNNLKMNAPFNTPVTNGDVVFHQFGSKKDFGTGLGLVFESPVFVNRDISLPTGDSYSPVTFADRVVLGNGIVKSGSAPYSPTALGGISDRLWSEAKMFGGFLKGIDTDGAFDQGLFVFAGLENQTPPDTGLMSKCIAMTNHAASSSFLKNATLGGVLKTTSNHEQLYELYFNQFDSFVPQIGLTSQLSLQRWHLGPVTLTEQSQPPVLHVTFRLGGDEFTANMAPNSTLNLSQSTEALGAQIQTLQNEIERLENRISDLSRPGGNNNGGNDTSPDNQNLNETTEEKIEKLRAQISELNQQITTLENRRSHPAAYALSLTQVSSTKLAIRLSNANVSNWIDHNGAILAPSLEILAYDSSYAQGVPIGGAKNPKLQGFLTYRSSGSDLLPPSGLSETVNGPARVVLEDSTDYDGLRTQCRDARESANASSFGGASWDTDFSPATRHSWNFAGDDDSVAGADPTFNKTLRFANGVSSFKVVSIAKECEIESTATLVTGFYTCDKLTIRSRTLALRIIGTFIVKSLVIEPEAFKAGIRWSSIYAPQAAFELRSQGLLHSTSGRDCETIFSASPIWNPIPSAQDYADRMACNVISLRAKANPFQWTSVNPDCGLVAGASNTSCKGKSLNYSVIELAREAGGQ